MSADSTSELNFEIIKDSYIGCFQKLLVINGRARRREYWIFFFVNLALGIIPFIGQIVALVTIIPNTTVGVRRLHDIGRSGKWWLLGFAPLLGIPILIAMAAAGNYGALGFIGVLIVLASIGVIVLLLVWAAKEGDHGENKYGPDPKGGRAKAITAKPATAARKGTAVSADKPKVCGKCGAKNAKNAKFCGGCGKPL